MGAYSAKKQLEGVRETNQANRDIASETNQMNLQLAREENAFNERLWNLTNQYNDPAKQVQRLRGAGLSSAAAAQAASGFEAQPIQSANLANQQIGAPMVAPPESAYAGLNIVGLMREVVTLMQQTKDLEMQATEQKYQEPMLLSKSDALALQNAQNRQSLNEALQTFPYRLSSIQSKAKQDALTPEVMEAQKHYVEEQFNLAKQHYSFLEKKNDLEIQHFQKELRNMDEEFNNLIKQGKFISSSTDLNDEQRKKAIEEGKLVKQDWLSQKLENALKRFGYPSTDTGKIASLVASGELSIEQVGEYQKNMADYLRSHGHYFNGSDESRQYWHNVLNEGTAVERNMNPSKQLHNWFDDMIDDAAIWSLNWQNKVKKHRRR